MNTEKVVSSFFYLQSAVKQMATTSKQLLWDCIKWPFQWSQKPEAFVHFNGLEDKAIQEPRTYAVVFQIAQN